MKIPFFNLERQYEQLREEIEPAVLSLLRSTSYIGGKAVNQFEKELADYLGVKYVISCGNGTDALYIALKSLGISEGDEVITTPFTFFATAEAIAQTGATPVFADIDPETLNLSVDSIEEKITDRTKAILPVHIFGLPAEMDAVNLIAKKNGLYVIEDACQAIGAEYKGKKAGALGDLACFSFYPTKNLGAFGDGGMIATNDEELAKVCTAIKSHASGKTGAEAYMVLHPQEGQDEMIVNESFDVLYDPYKYYNYFIGQNSRLDAVQATVLSKKLNYLNQYNSNRRLIADRYTEALKELPIQVPRISYEDKVSCFHQYVILSDEKEELVEYLSESGIGTGAFYPVPLHLQKAFKYLDYKEGSLPIVEKVCKQSVCLPIFPELYENEVEYIIEKIKAFYTERR